MIALYKNKGDIINCKYRGIKLFSYKSFGNGNREENEERYRCIWESIWVRVYTVFNGGYLFIYKINGYTNRERNLYGVYGSGKI